MVHIREVEGSSPPAPTPLRLAATRRTVPTPQGRFAGRSRGASAHSLLTRANPTKRTDPKGALPKTHRDKVRRAHPRGPSPPVWSRTPPSLPDGGGLLRPAPLHP